MSVSAKSVSLVSVQRSVRVNKSLLNVGFNSFKQFSRLAPSYAAAREEQQDGAGACAEVLPDPVRSSRRPAPRRRVQEEGLVVRALRRQVDSATDGDPPGQTAGTARSR